MGRTARALATAAASVVLVAAAALAQIGTANAESNGGVRVMPLGDSITDGFNVPGGYRIDLWQKLVAGGYTVDFVGSQSNGPGSLGDHDHQGHSGWTIAQIDANVVNWLRATTPRTILLHIGTNDMYGSDPAGAPNRLSTLIDRITSTSPTSELFVATIIPLGIAANTQVRTFNAAIPGIVQGKVNAGKRVHLVDMYSALTTSDLADGVHPNAGGYSKMATVWYNALRSVPGSLTNGSTTPPTTPPTSTPTATPTAVPTTPPTTSPTGMPPSGCVAAYTITGQWQGGFQAGVTVTATNISIAGWTVYWTYGNGQTVSQAWGATIGGTGASVTARNVDYNGRLAVGASTTFGFIGTWNGTNTVPSLSCVGS